MQKPTAVLAAVIAVAVPVALSTNSQAADAPTSPYTPQTTPAATTPKATTPVATTPAATTPKPTTPAATTPAPPAPAPGVVLTALKTAVELSLPTFTYTDVLAGDANVNFAVPGAGTYVVTVAYRKPAKKYRSVAKGVVQIPKQGRTTISVPLVANHYAPSTVRYAQHKKKVKVQVNYLYEIGNRTVQSTGSVLLDYK